MKIEVLIGTMVAIVVGVNLIPTITQTISSLPAEATTGLGALLGAMPYVFVAVILVGAVAWMENSGSLGSGKRTVEIELTGNSKKLILSIKRASKNLEPYLNNLDELLGITTIEDTKPGNNFNYGLSLTKENKLYISPPTERGGAYDWYLTDKRKDQNVFKVVGLHSSDENQNKVYLLGKEQATDKTYLEEVSRANVEIPIESIPTKSTQVNAAILGAMTMAVASSLLPTVIDSTTALKK